MSWDAIMQLIGSGLFPIAACLGMAWFFNKVNDNYRQDIKDLQATHREETKSLTEAVNNNTLVIQRLLDKLEGDEK